MGRPHVAGVMMRKGYVSSIQEAFDVWLAKGKPAYLERERLAPQGRHRPGPRLGGGGGAGPPDVDGINGPAMERFIAELAADGLDGMECEYGRYSPDLRAALRALAARCGLAVTGGSDYHGRYKPDLSLGTGLGDLNVPDDLLDALESRRP